MIEIRHLQTLLSLASTHSVKLSAAELSMTQSALSHQLKNLESQIGMRLFERKTQPLIWTQAGQALLNLAHEVLPRVAQTEQTLQALHNGEQGRLHIGVDCHTCFDWLLPLLRDYQPDWPGVDVDVVSSLSEQPVAALASRQLDLLITSDPVKATGIAYLPLFDYELVACVTPEHALADKSSLRPKDLAEHTLITYPVPHWKLDVFSRFLMPAKRAPRQVRYSELTLMMLQQVEAGRGVCVLPRWLLAAQPGFEKLVLCTLGKDGLWSRLYAGVSAQRASQPYVQDFIHRVAGTMQPEKRTELGDDT
jgi:LysR family transcriptional regulator for metE and metH